MSLFSIATLLTVSLHLVMVDSTYPTNCNDLAILGNNINGFFIVMNTTTSNTATVYCDFKLWTQSNITNAASPAKAGIFFHATKQTPFSGVAIITFELVRTNVGGAFNGSSGVFTVPVNGYYSFSFYGLKSTGSTSAWVALFVNNVSMADSYYGNLNNDKGTAAGLSGINTILQLSVGDQVYLLNKDGSTLSGDGNSRYSQFTGQLVQ